MQIRKLSRRQVMALGIMVGIVLAVVILVSALFTSPSLAGTKEAISTVTSSLSHAQLTTPLLQTLDDIKLTSPLTLITRSDATFHPEAFLHKGALYGIGAGTYLANGTTIYIISGESSPSFYHLTGLEEPGWHNDGRDSKFTLIAGLATSKDGSELYISDKLNNAIRLYIVEYDRMVDFAVGHYIQTGSRTVYAPELFRPSDLELYDTSLFVIVATATGSSKILQINIFTGEYVLLPDVPSTNHDVRLAGMVLRGFRLYVCLSDQVWAMDTIVVDAPYHMVVGSEKVNITPVWEKMISSGGDGLLHTNHIKQCNGVHTSPDFSILYVLNKASTSNEADSVLAFNLTSSTPQTATRLTSPTISRIRSIGVRASGQIAIVLSDNGLYSLSFDHAESQSKKCIYCTYAPPGFGYHQYNISSTRAAWVYQSQMSCLLDPGQLYAAFNNKQQVEGQIRYFSCVGDKLFWDGYVTWYTFIPYICSVDSPLKERIRLWSCDSYTCTTMKSGPAARPCQNGGVCTFLSRTAASSKTWVCRCPNGYSGDLCQQVQSAFVHVAKQRKGVGGVVLGGCLTAIVFIGAALGIYCFMKGNNGKITSQLPSGYAGFEHNKGPGARAPSREYQDIEEHSLNHSETIETRSQHYTKLIGQCPTDAYGYLSKNTHDNDLDSASMKDKTYANIKKLRGRDYTRTYNVPSAHNQSSVNKKYTRLDDRHREYTHTYDVPPTEYTLTDDMREEEYTYYISDTEDLPHLSSNDMNFSRYVYTEIQPAEYTYNDDIQASEYTPNDDMQPSEYTLYDDMQQTSHKTL